MCKRTVVVSELLTRDQLSRQPFFTNRLRCTYCRTYRPGKNPRRTDLPMDICFTGVDLRVENIQLFLHRRFHTGVRDEDVGSGTSALCKRQVRSILRE